MLTQVAFLIIITVENCFTTFFCGNRDTFNEFKKSKRTAFM